MARKIAFILAIAFTFGCGETADPEDTRTVQQSVVPAVDSYESITVDGVVRNYWLHLPPNYPNDAPYRVIMNLHGAGLFIDATSYMAKPHNQDLIDRADNNKVILVFPDGDGSWNTGFCCGPAFLTGRDDLTFIDDLATMFKSDPVLYDVNRIHGMGHSNGGMMIHQIAAESPTTFASVATVNSTVGAWLANTLTPSCDANDPTCTDWFPLNQVAPTAPVDIMMVQSMNDEVIPYDGGSRASGFEFSWYLPATSQPGYSDNSWNTWSVANGCTLSSISPYTVGELRTCTGPNADATMASLYDGDGIKDHEWPMRDTVNNTGFDTNKHIIQFFVDHPL